MADYTEEQRVKQRYPEANCVVHYEQDAWLIKKVKHHFGDPVYHGDVLGKSRISAQEAWADASRRLGNEFVDEVGPLAERKEG